MLKYIPIVIAAVLVSTEAFAVQECEKKPKYSSSVIRHGCGTGTGPWAVAPQPGQEELVNTFVKGYFDSPKYLSKQDGSLGKGGFVKY